jgi:hypothetical protein
MNKTIVSVFSAFVVRNVVETPVIGTDGEPMVTASGEIVTTTKEIVDRDATIAAISNAMDGFLSSDSADVAARMDAAIGAAIAIYAGKSGRARVDLVIMAAAQSLAAGDPTAQVEWVAELEAHVASHSAEVSVKHPWTGVKRYSTSRGPGGGIKVGI